MKAFLSAVLLLTVGIADAQQTVSTNSDTERKIRSLISQMTLQEKVSLLHANSKFYVSGIKRLGIPELALNDGPHGVRAEINRDNWAYAGWTNDSCYLFSAGYCTGSYLESLSWHINSGLVLGEEARFRKKDILLGPAINIIRSPLMRQKLRIHE